jgi:tRNA(fMet)-specific endonuclease VapC
LIDADRAGTTLDAAIDDGDDVAVAAITIAELLVGIALSDDKRRVKRQAFVEDVLGNIPIVTYDTTVASSHADLLVETRRQGKPRGAHDLIIAATARATQRSVVSADPSAFENLPGVTLRLRRR